MRAYITQDGRCTVPEQTAVAMFIALDAHDNLEPLKKQLYELLAERDFHHHCGMLGMQYLYPALDICGFQEEAYRIVTAKGRPSYTEWLDNGATTLWEMWHTGESKNHHMNSCVLAWFVKTMLGLRPADEAPGFARAELRPYFLTALDFCKGRYKTAAGVYEIAWEKQQDATVLLRVQVPQGTRARLILSGYTIGESGSSEADLQAGRHDMICRMMGLS